MLAKKKEKDVIDLMLDKIDFHGLTAEVISGENGLLKQLTIHFYAKALEAEMDSHLGHKKKKKMTMPPSKVQDIFKHKNFSYINKLAA